MFKFFNILKCGKNHEKFKILQKLAEDAAKLLTKPKI